MTSFLIRLICFAIALQPLLDFAAGQRFEILLFGKYWMPVHLVLMFGLYLWVISFPLESRAGRRNSVRSLPKGILVTFGFAGTVILFQALRGLQLGYYSTLGDTETLFWIFVMAVWGYSARMDEAHWRSAFSILEKGASVIALLAIIYVLGHEIGGLPIPGFVHYNALFLMVFGFFVSLSRWLECDHRKDRLLFGLFSFALLININKAIIFSLAFALPSLLWALKRSKTRYHRKAMDRFITFGLAFFLLFGILLVVDTLLPTGLGEYYFDYWQTRVLHNTPIDAVDLRTLSGGRTDLWELALYWLQQSPWLGWGIGFRLAKELELVQVTSGLNAHNQYVYLLTAMGIPASAVLAFGLLQYLRLTLPRGMQNAQRGAPTELMYPALSFIWTMLAFGLGGLWNIAPAAYALFGLCLGGALQFAVLGMPLTNRTLAFSQTQRKASNVESRLQSIASN